SGTEESALMAQIITAPDGPDDRQRLLEAASTLIRINTQGPKLAAEITRTSGEGETTTREHIESRTRLGDQKRVPIRQHDDVGQQPQPLRRRRNQTQRSERIQ